MTYLPAAPRRSRHDTRIASVFMVGFVAGVGVAALVVPGQLHRSPASVSAAGGAPAGGAPAGGVPGASGGTGAADSTGPNAVQAAGGASGRSAAGSGAVSAASGIGAKGGGGSVGAATGAGAAGSGAASSHNNGGATFRGVSATSITIAMENGDYSSLGAACPRCSNGNTANGDAANALVAAWKRDGLDTVNGRQINVINAKYNGLNSEEAQSTCEAIVAQDHPFVVGDLGTPPCAVNDHVLSIDGNSGGDQTTVTQEYPYVWALQATFNTTWANYPIFLDQNGQLKNQVLCMYSADDSVQAGMQEDLGSSFRAELHKLGYKLAVDITYGVAANDPVAVAQFRSKGCTVAFVVAGGTAALTEPSGFQNIAEQQGYRPRYPIAEALGIEMTDSVADVAYNATSENGNIGMRTNFWNWSSGSPPVAIGNSTAQYCINAYQAYEHRTLSVYANDAELLYLLQTCSVFEVARQAIINAGPDLTQNTFVAGIEQIHGMQTSLEPTVSFGPTKTAGADVFTKAVFNKNRWQPSNDYWGDTGPWIPFYLGSFGS